MSRTDPEWENFFASAADTGKQPLEKVLGGIPIFSLLRAKELRTLARLVHVRQFAPGETVIRRGVQQSGFYMIRTGAVQIVRERGDEREIVTTLGPPELLGEFALLDDTPRSTSVVAAEPSTLIGFFKPDLMDILTTNPEMGCMILLRLGEEMTATLNNDYSRLLGMGWPFDDQPADDGLDPTTT